MGKYGSVVGIGVLFLLFLGFQVLENKVSVVSKLASSVGAK